MSRNTLYGLIGVAVYAYQQSQRSGLEVKVDGNGLQIHGTGGDQ